MKNILILITLLFFTINSYSQEYTLLEINSEWNYRNNAKIAKVKGVKHVIAMLESQKPSFKQKIKSVPTVILYKDNHAIAQWDGGLSMKLELKEEDILAAIERDKKPGRAPSN
jgi:hypothetical protein